jgi:hypothetical protein
MSFAGQTRETQSGCGLERILEAFAETTECRKTPK